MELFSNCRSGGLMEDHLDLTRIERDQFGIPQGSFISTAYPILVNCRIELMVSILFSSSRSESSISGRVSARFRRQSGRNEPCE